MSGGSWPDEPDEPDPKPEEFDPMEDIGPEIPEVSAPDPEDTEIPAELFRTFWKLVATFNVAIFALALGPMLVFFRGELVDGTVVFLVGVAFFVYGYLGYRAYVDERDSDE